MSEKNAGGGGAAHWAKSAAAAAAAATAAAIQKQQHPIYDGSGSGASNNSLVHTSNALYGHCSIPGLQQQPTDIAYAASRFQTPSIHHDVGSTGASCATPVAHPPQVPLPSSVRPMSTPTNVPVPSGFVPPPFPTTPAAAATSVLTPNPFAPAFAVAAGAASALEQFQRLNVQQQQLELGKIVNAINISGQSATSPAVPTLIGGAQLPAVAAAQQVMVSPSLQRPHGEPSVSSANSAGGTINSTIAENVLNAISLGQSGVQGRLLHVGVKAPDGDKIRRVQQVVESGLDEFSKQTITQIVERVSNLKPVERLLLYLRLPGETAESDPLRQPQNPLGTRSEITHTINWVRSHLEHDPQVSIPKQDVYNDYIAYCERLSIKPLSTADFGKVMKQVFPGIRPRRLGTRGNSRYCYAAMRKTTQLAVPQLPQLCRSFATGSPANSDSMAASEFNTSGTVAMHADSDVDSWHVVKSWAEKLLNVKVENMKDLATRIKNGNTMGPTGTAVRLGPKKYTPREPKEKRLLADLGPLKKRRKKKRKGSSSSESSCNQLPKDVLGNQETAAFFATTTAAGVALAATTNTLNSEDEQKTFKLVKVKKEVMDSPNFANTQQQILLPLLSPMTQNALITDTYLAAHQQQQMMPMNLATEQRSMLAKAPTANNALRGQFSAARNLTPKILEITANSANVSAQSIAEEQSTAHQPLVTIKDEVDDYSTSNIFCKKVLKAQQTKGFWTNNNNNMVPPIITTTASTPPPTNDQVPTGGTALENTGSSPVTNLTMGPPTQMTSNTSISPSSSLDAGPRVVSRNSLLLRAKKAMAAEAAADDSGLPENLGLPRERVISICNMDKHELDGYLLGEAENEEDQETELLQYFQTGDAEEKRMNSLDAAITRNPIEHNATPTTGTTVSTRLSLTATAITAVATPSALTATVARTKAASNITTSPLAPSAGIRTKMSIGNHLPNTRTSVGIINTNSDGLQMASQSVAAVGQVVGLPQNTTKTTTNALGSASASLALMSQKHQIQQYQQQQQHQQLNQKQQQKQKQHPQLLQAICISNNNNNNNNNNNSNTGVKLNVKNNKRKISLSTATILHHNNNKNCIFLPISPNINNQSMQCNEPSSNTIPTAINESGTIDKINYSSSTNAGCFASPGLTRLRTRAPTLTKQQSLDFDSVGNSSSNDNSSDPMIGASRRRRSYVNPMNSSTSASAPPSPSALQQVYNSIGIGISNWSLGNSINANANVFNDAANNVALLADQNSMDLESSIAFAHATGDVDFQLTPLNETQRSQSVPLSQLQRIQSPIFSRQLDSYQSNYSACTSVNQTPVPADLAGDSSTLFSENSNSQAALKLNDVDVLVQDSSALLDDVVDVSAMLSNDFSTKFASIAQHAQHASATTCSSTGSSSGYSSGTGNAFGSMSLGSGIISRSVPSTPLPHHQQNSFGNSAFYSRRNDDYNLSPLTASGSGLHGFGSASSSLAHVNSNNNNNNSNGTGPSAYGARNAYDISKSMPTTPITTPCFRYSPVELQRDFLINGNTIDSLTSSNFGTGCGGGGGGTSDGLSGVGNLSTDTLIDDSAPAGDVEAIIAGSDILGNL